MNEQLWLSAVAENRAIAVIRASSYQKGYHMAEAVIRGGMRMVEIAWNSDRAPELIQNLRSTYPNCVIGAGTLFACEDVRGAIASGAQFLFAPHFEERMLREATKHQIPMIPGALTPSEIVKAWQGGASSVKVFPAASLGGADYIARLQEVLPEVPLIPTGGVTVENAGDFLNAGAIAVGLSGSLFPKQVLEAEHWESIAQRSEALVSSITQ
jgi:2-dehydro-3-deoxyphosphogluconate aldolase/(4S)-4-hydroxy-2-oxoglutarate aldolase